MLNRAIIGFIQVFGRLSQKNPNEFFWPTQYLAQLALDSARGPNEGLAMDMTPLSTQSIYLAAIIYKAQS